MKNRVLVLLIVLALAATSGLSLASAQSSTMLKVVTLGETSVYAEASAEAEVVDTLAVSTVVELLGVAGDFYMVDGGYVMAADVAVMNLPALAPKVIVSTSRAGQTALFDVPNVGGNLVATLPDGTVASLLATDGELAFVMTMDGQMGWSVTSAWDVAPEGFAPAMISLRNTDQVGVFAEGNISSEITGTLTEGDGVYVYDDSGADLVEVMLMDGSMGYVRGAYLNPVPMVYVDAVAGRRANPALFAAPDFAADLVGELHDGDMLVYVASVDDFWAEVYSPVMGMGYALKDSLSNVYTVGTVQEANALVRDGAGSQYYEVAQLQAGDQVIIKGMEGDWFEVAIPFDAYFGFNGKPVFMFGDLLADQALEYDFDVSLFAAAE